MLRDFMAVDIKKDKKYGEPGKDVSSDDSAHRQSRCNAFMYTLQHPSIEDRVEKKGRKGAGLEKYNN